MTLSSSSRDGFSSRLGIIAAAAGSAIGLGNIWKFPYITGEYGGAAFILVYLICIALIGLPIMLSEFIIGRKAQKNAIGAFKDEAPGTQWALTGVLGLTTAFIILSFYSVVAGWTLHYVGLSVTGSFKTAATADLGGQFGAFIANPWLPIFWQAVFMALTVAVVFGGVKNGIERYSKILMPLLLVILVILAVRSMTLEGASEGIRFLFQPDFSKLNIDAVLAAMGHAFFSLSLGMGTMITYGSYIGKQENLGSTALQVSVADTVIALIAGLAIFPAVFAFSIEPSSGPGLVFITLPNVFSQMAFGSFFAVLFFALLAVAALTSAISILEVVVAYLDEEFGWSRKKSTLIVAISITIVGAILSQGNGAWGGLKLPFLLGGEWKSMNIFDWFVTLSDQLLPIGGFFIAIFVGWKLGDKAVLDELSNGGRLKIGYFKVLKVVLRFIAPLAIAFVFLSSIFGFFA
ncbi:sodium-dependent transporter [Reinekea blandensis]|uniref:Transporter n=1 Tax=Reinekea blandensis MED297 TaxID=314283 RepID=A4BFV9_9GAMM|nr:sodium-dependent transporter [Reinekea blandensis]EAR08977.1 sodium-dependent transporter [Reinekea sp. MED297] [Reinekea blandensis MED297]